MARTKTMHAGLFIMCTFLFLFAPFTSHAQNITNDDIFLLLTPTNPGPNTNVTLEIKSYVIAIDSYSINWTVNGALFKSGIGEKKISLNTGPLGTNTAVAVSVSLGTGATLSQQITLSPSTTDILWEAIGSYVPPFYKGKKLVSSEGTVRVVGIPDASIQGDAIYNWQQQFKAVQDASGYEKDSYEFSYNILNERQTVSLNVTGRSNQATGKNSTEIKITDPKLVFYPVDRSGIVDLHQGSTTILPFTDSVTLEATPYYFSTTNPRTLTYKWSMNREPLENTSERLYLESGGVTGTSRIRAQVDHRVKFLQSADLEITTSF